MEYKSITYESQDDRSRRITEWHPEGDLLWLKCRKVEVERGGKEYEILKMVNCKGEIKYALFDKYGCYRFNSKKGRMEWVQLKRPP